MSFSPSSIFYGLASAQRDTICSLLALYDASTLGNLTVDFGKDRADWIGVKFFDQKAASDSAFATRLAQHTEELTGSKWSDEQLRMRLWMNLRWGLGLDPDLTFSQSGIAGLCTDMGQRAAELFAQQKDDEAASEVSVFDKTYWSEFANRRLNPFSGEKLPVPDFTTTVQECVLRLVAGAAARGELDERLKAEAVARVQEIVNGLDADKQRELMRSLGVEELGEEAALRLLAGGGGLVGVGLAVEMAGFAAYILAAKAAAIIPLVGSQTLISGLAVIANPLFIIPVIAGGGVWMSGDLRQKLCANFSVTVAAILVLSAVSRQQSDGTPLVQCFKDYPMLLPDNLREQVERRHVQAQEQRSTWQEETRKRASGTYARMRDWFTENVSSAEFPDAYGYYQRYLELHG